MKLRGSNDGKTRTSSKTTHTQSSQQQRRKDMHIIVNYTHKHAAHTDYQVLHAHIAAPTASAQCTQTSKSCMHTQTDGPRRQPCTSRRHRRHHAGTTMHNAQHRDKGGRAGTQTHHADTTTREHAGIQAHHVKHRRRRVNTQAHRHITRSTNKHQRQERVRKSRSNFQR